MTQENTQPGSARKTIWSFDLGKASIGEAVRDLKDDSFPHLESLLIPFEFAETQSAASRRRMWRTRIAHHAREDWLARIVKIAGFEPLRGRRMEKTAEGWRQVPENAEEKKRRAMLEREFPAKGDETQYNSAALRILLLERETKLEEWQIYKALRSAIQKRGYGRVPWSNREEKRGGKSEEEMEKEMAKKDPGYRAAIEAWPKFKQQVLPEFHFPCYYDAAHTGIWSPEDPSVVKLRQDHHAESTRRVRFDRTAVEREITLLADAAAEEWPALGKAFERIRAQGWRYTEHATKRERMLPVVAETLGEFLVHGPAGTPSDEALEDFHRYLEERRARGIRPGTEDDWQAATGQKTPRFDNRIVEPCALLDGLRVCNVAVRLDPKTKAAQPDSLLYSEVTFLMKLKNTRVEGRPGYAGLTSGEIRKLWETALGDVAAISLQKIESDIRKKKPDAKDDEVKSKALRSWEEKVSECFSLVESDPDKKSRTKKRSLHSVTGLRPAAGHEVVRSPKSQGRSRHSRPALRLIRSLILSGNKPSEFKRRLLVHDAALLAEIGLDVLAAPLPPRAKIDGKPEPQRRPYVLESQLKFLDDLIRENDTWEKIHLPEQRLDALEERHSTDGHLDREAAVRDLIGSINDPVVRHRLGVFTERLCELERQFGRPDEIVLEFVREDFMGEKAKDELKRFQNEREEQRKHARKMAAEAGASGKAAGLRYELLKAQGNKCLYCGQDFHVSKLDDYPIEHIVPRAQGGPDAMVNYVLAHEKCNDEKGDMTPYQWKYGKEGWSGYVELVKQHATALRNKKVQLLTREDAAELVQRYTALAETAWISRLAQKIAGLWFGWRNGNDAENRKRITVISGGFTARIRRRYRLNSLLNQLDPDFVTKALAEAEKQKGSRLSDEERKAATRRAEDDWEAAAGETKNRKDHRHHALDAMVINFWNTGSKKQDADFFRFPPAIHRNALAYFRERIEPVNPMLYVREKPAIQAMFYGKRQLDGSTFIVKRRPLLELGTKEVKNKKVLKPLADIRQQAQTIVDGAIRRIVIEFLEAHGDLTLEQWTEWCDNVTRGDNGPRIKQVQMRESAADKTENYHDFGKDQTARFGQFRKADQCTSYFVIAVPTPSKKDPDAVRYKRRAVYAFDNRNEKRMQIQSEPGVRVVDEFWPSCQVRIEHEWELRGRSMPPGLYRLHGIEDDGRTTLSSPQAGLRGTKDEGRASLAVLMQAGMKRVRA